MTTLTDTQVITASGGLVELGYSQVTSPVSPTSTSFPGNLLGPSVTIVSDGSPSVIEFFSSAARPALGAGGAIYFVLYEDGSPKVRQWGACVAGGASDDAKPVHLQYRFTPTPGSHTYTVYAYVTGGTGYVGGGDGGAVSTQAPMFLRVSKIVQATQWPAVTTGTIICTSSTRPASPFEGQRIYQTDDKRELVYNGSAWVTTTPVGASTPDSGTRGSTSYGALTGGGTNPSVTVQTGTSALVTLGSWCQVGSNVAAYVSFKVSGATTRASSDNDMIALYQFNTSNVEAAVSRTVLVTGLTAGSNTFELEYKGNVSSTLTYQRRSIVVQGIP